LYTASTAPAALLPASLSPNPPLSVVALGHPLALVGACGAVVALLALVALVAPSTRRQLRAQCVWGWWWWGWGEGAWKEA
jgi:hypothetical protein